MVSELGGYGRYWALILPSAVSVFNILVLRSFYSTTASELIDAARMDGAGEWRILWSVVLPTSRAVNAVITLFYAVGYWNTFFSVMLYMPAESQKWPLQYVLYQYVNGHAHRSHQGVRRGGGRSGRARRGCPVGIPTRRRAGGDARRRSTARNPPGPTRTGTVGGQAPGCRPGHPGVGSPLTSPK
ncbi:MULTISPECIES: ABC transporter permease subunit [unclassified Streptomyces]|uniref:ABC transporter permease subunit n=1 Tax=unclassified Streptomyces TaxID=2593676 RepID=UPI002253412F|nr:MULTISPECIES: ABC transporter permease subunit [unclassified Streptomyces]MCX5336133.1 ABC transporter permease subunit [Streptomyces sp. NBC_00140]MCX5366854.1 ABC transporter permease subunit [Streptomyces sp. NBC_00124]